MRKPAAWWVLALLLAATAGADERILSYRAEIVVQTDAWIAVSETIRVRAEGADIKHGIYREFPVRYRAPSRLAVLVPFDVLSVERDGRPEPYHTKGEG